MPKPPFRFAARGWAPLFLPGALGLALLLGSCEQARPTETPATPASTAPAAATDSEVARPASPTAPATAGPDSTHLLAAGRAGALRVGMRVGELRQRYGPLLREVTLRRDDNDFPGFALGKVKGSPMPAVLLEPLCQDGEDNPDGSVSDHCRIWRITIRDPAYRTAAGLGVGSRYGHLRLAAPISYVGPTPMGIAATCEEWQMNFLLDPAPIEARNLPLRRETIHDSVRVTGVQLIRP